MTAQHYAFQEWVKRREDLPSLRLFALVDGIQYERATGESLKVDNGVHSLFSLPEDRAIAFAGPWLLDISALPEHYFLNISQLEKRYPAVSWILSEQPFSTLVRHLQSCLMVSLPSKQTGLLRFYDCRVLKKLPELLSSAQLAELMKYGSGWLFLHEGILYRYQWDAGRLRVSMMEKTAENRESA